MATVNFTIPCFQDSAGGDNATVDVTVDGTTVSSNNTISSTDSDSPNNVTFSVALTDASHVMEIIFTNPYYVDSDNDRNVIFLNASYQVAHDTFITEDGLQKSNQGKLTASGMTSVNSPVHYLKDSQTALNIDGQDIPNSGETAWTGYCIVWQDRATVTFTFATNNENVAPYRAVLDADSSPPTLSNTITIPWGDDLDHPPVSVTPNAAAVQFANP